MHRENMFFEHFISQALDKRRLYYTIFGMLLILQLCPIWFTTYPPLHDYPNHLARAHILHQYGDVESYRSLYERDWRLFPNLAIDLIVPALLHLVSIETASKIFLSLIIVLFNVGAHALGVAVKGRPHESALAASFFTFNFSFSYGFVNYMFGLGVFFVSLAVWLRMRAAWTVSRLLLVSLLALTSYFSHLSSFVFLAVAVVCLTVLDLPGNRNSRSQRLLGLLPLAPAIVAYLFYTAGIEHRGPMEWWSPIMVKKLAGLSYPFVSHNLVIDLALSGCFVILVLTAFLTRVGRFASKELFLVGSLFVLLYLVFPMSAAQSYYVDRRFIVPAAVMVLLALHIDSSKVIGRYLMIGLLVLSVARVSTVWKSWTDADQEIGAQVHALDVLPDGVTLYPMLMYDTSAESWMWDMHFYYSAHYATIYRHAFVPTIYAWNAVNPVRLRRSPQIDYAHVERGPRLDGVNWDNDYTRIEQGTPLGRVKWDAIRSKYDYLWGYKLSEEFKRFLLSEGQLVAQSGNGMLFRIRKA